MQQSLLLIINCQILLWCLQV